MTAAGNSFILPWHDAAWSALLRQFRGDRAPHALLLVGLPGLGKRALATRLAAWLLCERREEIDGACHACRACDRFAAGTHPDLHPCGPEEAGKQIPIDSVRALAAALQLTSHHGGWKVAIIDPADHMNLHSHNALLKTLEEPAGMTLLVLVSARPSRLPATIRSRCQRIALSPPVHDVAQDWLERQGLDQAGRLLALAGGAPIGALELAGMEFIGQRRALFDSLVELIDGRSDAASAAAAWNPLPLPFAVRWLQTLVHDLIRLKRPESAADLVNDDLRQGLHSLAQRIDLPALFRYLDELLRVQAIADTLAKPQLQMESLLVAWGDALDTAA